jgi:hypothetical protein
MRSEAYIGWLPNGRHPQHENAARNPHDACAVIPAPAEMHRMNTAAVAL